MALTLIVGVVYANSWHDSLIFDDKLFVDYQRFSDLAEIPRYFVDHVWAERMIESGLYRPMLFISVGVDARLFGEWFAGPWLLIKFIGSKPFVAWGGLLFAYTFALFSRETAIVLPGLAVVVLFAYSSGSPADRLRGSLGVLLLLVPMLVYLVLRGNALSGGELGPVW